MNMAIDEAIMQARIAGEVPNTLRLYQWKPSAVSIGRNQTAQNEVYLEAAKQLGVDIVRRASGGGAVYHDSAGEVTYSVVAGVADLGSADVTSVYTRIYHAVTDALRLLGVPADFNGGTAKNCPNLTVAGKKISGSSQTISRGVVLQHGTILVNADVERMFRLLKLPGASCSEAAEVGQRKITSIQQELGHRISAGTVANALAQGFKAIIKIQLQEGELTAAEKANAEKLYREKYSKDEWNFSGKT
jgi:lipoate-protein ligase A